MRWLRILAICLLVAVIATASAWVAIDTTLYAPGNPSRGRTPDRPAYVTSVSGASNPESIQRDEVVWLLIVRLASQGDGSPRGGSMLTAAMGLDEGNAARLMEYARASLAEDRKYQQQIMRELCAGLNPNLTAQALASKLDAVEHETGRWRAARVANLSTLLDSKANEGLDQWVSRQRGSMGVAKVDYYKMLQDPRSRGAILQRAMEGCKAPRADRNSPDAIQ